jgi:hypothetical protein
MKSRSMGWIHRREKRNSYKISVGKPDGRPLERSKCRQDDASIINTSELDSSGSGSGPVIGIY